MYVLRFCWELVGVPPCFVVSWTFSDLISCIPLSGSPSNESFDCLPLTSRESFFLAWASAHGPFVRVLNGPHVFGVFYNRPEIMGHLIWFENVPVKSVRPIWKFYPLKQLSARENEKKSHFFFIYFFIY